MTHGAPIWIRVLLAFAIGAGMVLIGWANYLIAVHKLAWLEPIGMNAAWLEVLLPFLCSFALCFKWRPLRGGSPAPGNWLVDLDSSGLLIPLVIVIGLNIAQTIVLIWEYDDRTDYSLVLVEYIMSSLKVGVPALAGSMLARAMSWAVNRVRVQ
jgi:hypothetical protein